MVPKICMYEEPSWANAGWLTLDALALGVPILSTSGTVKYLDDVDDVVDGAKLMDKGFDGPRVSRKQ